MNIKNVGIVGASGYGGNELIRLVLGHPGLKLAYVAANSSAGKKLSDLMPWISGQHDLTIEKWNADTPPALDLIFISLPSGHSKTAVNKINDKTKIIDLGGDHRFVDGWTYGLADIWPEKVRKATRIANPGCYPTAALTALAPLMNLASCNTRETVIIDAKSGISGVGRGGGNETSFGFSEVNENVSAYKLTNHVHIQEIRSALGVLTSTDSVPVVFTPHLIPMTRGILTTCYVRCNENSGRCFEVAREFYKTSPFVRVSEKPPHSKWATGTNLVFVSYASNESEGIVTAIAVIDNLGKGAASQAIQNANLMFGMDMSLGLENTPLAP